MAGMRQAVIIAGGQATRMRPYSEDRPKAMVEIAGEPIVGRQLRWLQAAGVTDVVVSVGYRADVLTDYVEDGSPFGLRVSYAVEDEPLGRGGGLRLAAERRPFRGEGFYAVNGDVLADFSLLELAEAHRSSDCVATLALAPYKSNWGVVDLDGDLVSGFRQSPVLPYFINAGIYCMNPEMVELLPRKGDHEDSTFPQLAAAGMLKGFKIAGYWRGVDTVKDVLEATRELTPA
jgi:NDP-sugar pyrophosphorylase family protein